MSEVLDRIAAWQDAGLIDSATAGRLRAAEGAADTLDSVPGRPRGVASAAGTFFGPTPTIMEVFAYLGAGFFIGAWAAFLTRIAGFDESRDAIIAGGTALLSAVLIGVALFLRRGDARHRRGAGVALLLAALGAGIAMNSVGQVANVDYSTTQVLVFGAAFAVAVLGRWLLPSVMTQVAVLGSLTGLAASAFSAVETALTPTLPPVPCCEFEAATNPWLAVVLPAVGWIVIALVIGAIGLRESRSAGEPAQRRAALSRFWAGLVAVLGVATAVLRDGSLGNGDWGRIIEPWLGEAVLVVIALVLLERAFRRNSAAFLACAAIALVIALTDFNFHYLTNSTDIGLLVEGVILLAVGVGADRLRRRLDRSRGTPATTNEPLDPATVA